MNLFHLQNFVSLSGYHLPSLDDDRQYVAFDCFSVGSTSVSSYLIHLSAINDIFTSFGAEIFTTRFVNNVRSKKTWWSNGEKEEANIHCERI